jgi:NADH pyrophosphatase NudC (nudix superfamily)
MNKKAENRREKLRREIVNASRYKDGDYYLGGMESHGIIRALMGVYGENTIEDLVKTADLQELKAAHRLLTDWGFVKLAKQREIEREAGVRFCPHCGGKLP